MTLQVHSSGFATVQDRGWSRGRSFGLPLSGALDREALAIGNALVGNPPDAAVIEFTAGSLEVEFDTETTVAFTGGTPDLAIDDRPYPGNATCHLDPGQRLVARPDPTARFGYLAVAGGIATGPVLGSRSTYLPTRLGGFHGRTLRRGDRVPIGRRGRPPSSGTAAPRPPDHSAPIRLVPIGHRDSFGPRAWESLVDGSYRVTAASDRMGTRLAGEAIGVSGEAILPSEGMTVGAIQVPPNGQPIVVLADGPTVGGYPGIGAVITADLGRFAQMPLGGAVRFQWVSTREAQRLLRGASERLANVIREIG